MKKRNDEIMKRKTRVGEREGGGGLGDHTLPDYPAGFYDAAGGLFDGVKKRMRDGDPRLVDSNSLSPSSLSISLTSPSSSSPSSSPSPMISLFLNRDVRCASLRDDDRLIPPSSISARATHGTHSLTTISLSLTSTILFIYFYSLPISLIVSLSSSQCSPHTLSPFSLSLTTCT